MAVRSPRVPLAARAYAWLGGILFAASVAYFAYVFLVRWGRPADVARSTETILAAVLIDVGLFTLFATHHSVMARSGAKRWLARRLPANLERGTYVWISSALFFLTCVLWEEVPGVLYAHRGVAAWPHHLVQAIGALLAWRATAVLDALDLAGISQVEGPGATPEFRVAGPYRFVRHPLYLAWMLFVFGAAHMTATRFTFACISSAYLIVAIPWEERSLSEMFGNRHREYVGRVRWRLVPRVY